jgi:hypothetical protein
VQQRAENCEFAPSLEAEPASDIRCPILASVCRRDEFTASHEMELGLSEMSRAALPLPIATAAIGLVVLLFGRKLFWLCVAAVGFAAGVELAPRIVHEPSTLLIVTAALILGFAGALLAMLLQKFAIGVLGFLTGGRLAVAIAAAFLNQQALQYWVIFIIGGIVGALLLLALFDWALIFLSSFLGAYLIGNAVTLPYTGATILFVLLVIVGLVAQTTALRRTRRSLAD